MAVTGRKAGIDATAIQKCITERQNAIVDLTKTMLHAGAALTEIEASAAEIAAEVEELKQKLWLHEQENAQPQSKDMRLDEILTELDSNNLDLTVYDDSLVRRLIDGIKVVSKEKILVQFSWGVEVEVNL